MSKVIDIAEQTALEFTSRIPALLAQTPNSGSLIEYTKATRVEPLVLVDRRAVNIPFMQDVMQTLNAIFCGYYLQAVALSVNVGKVDTLKLLDKLNPKRDPLGAAVNYTTESIKLPRPDEDSNVDSFGIEGIGDTQKLLSEASNLAVGRVLEVTIDSDGKSVKFPVMVRMIINAIDSEILVHTLGSNSKDVSAKERFHAWRSGQLKFIRDLVLSQDLIDDHRKNLMKDKTNFYAETLKRRNKNNLSAILSGQISVATASNIYVISDETRKELEREIGGKLDNFKVRERVFKETYGMILCVVDPEWEQVTIYHRSIEHPTELSARDMKSSNRGTGPEIMDILKAYQLGNSPSL